MELLLVVLQIFGELTLFVVSFAVAPVRFCFSSTYRSKVMASWHGKPFTAFFSVLCGMIALACLGGMIWLWAGWINAARELEIARKEPLTESTQSSLKEKLWEEAQDFARRKLDSWKERSGKE